MDRTISITAQAAPASTTAPGAPAIAFSRYWLFGLPAVLGFTLDLATKAWCFQSANLRAGGIYWLWEDHVGIQLSRNLGALFGVGQGGYIWFAALSVAAGIAIPIWL